MDKRKEQTVTVDGTEGRAVVFWGEGFGYMVAYSIGGGRYGCTHYPTFTEAVAYATAEANGGNGHRATVAVAAVAGEES